MNVSGVAWLCQDAVDELLCSRSEWHMSHTRTGLG